LEEYVSRIEEGPHLFLVMPICNLKWPSFCS
jgi:hypothetical protein